jgi:triosephosphate isomerase
MKYLIANWKMNLTAVESKTHVKTILKNIIPYLPAVNTVICPSFVSLSAVAEVVNDSGISLGAQNCFWEEKGSFTGEVSPSMLKDFGVGYVIIGHSERRQQLQETEEMINKKIQTVLRAGLVPILCVGETFSERQLGRKDFVIAGQVESAFKNIQLLNKKILIAYEPVWVIGSGQAVKIDEAEHAVRVIKQVLIDLYPNFDLKRDAQIIYGGSVDAKNISYFTSSDLLEGVLVGGASLDVEEFSLMAKIMFDNFSK